MIAMAKAVYYPKGERQKTIIKLLNSLEGRYSRWDIWQDFIVLSAVSIANAFGGPYREQREAMYLERSKKYSTSELEVLAQMLAEVVDEMEQNPDQDMLGELFMALGLANEWKGQFFTPYDICRAMAAMNLGEDLKSQIEEKGWVSVSDPACGAGALLLAFANECKRNHINYQTSVFFVAQDIDFLAGCMCYIQAMWSLTIPSSIRRRATMRTDLSPRTAPMSGSPRCISGMSGIGGEFSHSWT